MNFLISVKEEHKEDMTSEKFSKLLGFNGLVVTSIKMEEFKAWIYFETFDAYDSFKNQNYEKYNLEEIDWYSQS